MGFHPRLSVRDELQDILRRAEEKSMPAIDQTQLYRANIRPALLLRRPYPMTLPHPDARNLQSRAATLRGLPGLGPQRLAQAAPELSAGSKIEMGKNGAAE